MPGRRPPEEYEAGSEGDGKEQQEGSSTPPATAHPVGEDAYEWIIYRVPNDPHQYSDGCQSGVQSDHIREKDGIKNLAQGAVTGRAPVTRSIDQFNQ